MKFFIVNGKSKYTSIHIRFWDSNRIDQKTKTGIAISPDDWSSSKQRLKPKATTTNKDFFNHQLEQIERYVIDKYNLDYNSKKFISDKWLKGTVENFFGRVTETNNHKIYFVDWVELFVKNAPKRIYNGKPITDRTIKNYTTTLLDHGIDFVRTGNNNASKTPSVNNVSYQNDALIILQSNTRIAHDKQ
ncbi:hypothetical protein [Flavobacterium sp.]|uniref:hypothetical protein n=1 Tax=Flavobacterium sp. TaxID=239 RepID=UPI0025BC4246|nr:hypothetical protein [Flavobacterium sp.]